MKVIICCISFLLLSICPSLLAMEGTGVALKVSLSGKIYKRFSFVLEEDIRPRDDFREAGWFLTTGEINYRILPNLRLYVVSPLQGIGGSAQPVLPVRLRFSPVRGI